MVRLRLDLLPGAFTLGEIDYAAGHPEQAILFAPSPAWHGHPGGGGGCNACSRCFREAATDARAMEDFLATHLHHGNDICDLFAVGSPRVMTQYTRMFDDSASLYRRLKRQLSAHVADYVLEPWLEAPGGSASVQRIVSTRSGIFDMEASPIFVPEKLIRINMEDALVVHSESLFHIMRR